MGRKKTDPDPQVLAREAEVVKLRRGGLTFDMIASQLGYSDASGAWRAWKNAQARVVYEDVVETRKIEADRLDIAQAAIWPKVMRGDTNAVHALVRLMERRAKLLGLDQPLQMHHTVSTDMARQIAELARELDVVIPGLTDGPSNVSNMTPADQGFSLSPNERDGAVVVVPEKGLDA